MKSSRTEAFSDGVLAIIITIMVLEMKRPDGAGLSDLLTILPSLMAYVLSYLYVGIYWNNHHHLMSSVEKVGAKLLWANMHWLFWMSLIPIATAWMAEHHTSHYPVALYGVVMTGTAVAYLILQRQVIVHSAYRERMERAYAKDWKGKVSLISYIGSVVLAFFVPVASEILFLLVALLWFIPDRRVEKVIGEE